MRQAGRDLLRDLPGVMLCGLVAAVAVALGRAEAAWFGRAWLEPLVLAILIGTVIRAAWTPAAFWDRGIHFSAKILLEVAVVLLGASVSAATVLATGPALLAGIAVVVSLAFGASYGLGRLLKLPHRMSVLIASGNSICGNSAIAAVAPVIGADGEDVAASIGFTAVLGVAVVLLLPLLVPLLSLSGLQYGVLAGLTVYAVPQVLAAAAPMGMTAVHIGTLVKLVRVLLLGPVVFGLSLMTRSAAEGGGQPARIGLWQMVPWFIVGFLVMVALRSARAIPALAVPPAALVANLLTIVSMAGLGLGTDVKLVAKAGARVSAVVTLSLVVLVAISLGLIRLLRIG